MNSRSGRRGDTRAFATLSSGEETLSGLRIPPSLKKDIMAKRMEWLDANALGRAEVSDPIEEELEVLEREASCLNAGAFKLWKRMNYG